MNMQINITNFEKKYDMSLWVMLRKGHGYFTNNYAMKMFCMLYMKQLKGLFLSRHLQCIVQLFFFFLVGYVEERPW